MKKLPLLLLLTLTCSASAAKIIDLGTQYSSGTGEARSSAQSINKSGKAVGLTRPEGSRLDHAFLYANGKITDLSPGIVAEAINNLDHVVGAFHVGQTLHAFFLHDGIFEDLVSNDSPTTVAYALNDLDQVVGTTFVAPRNCTYVCDPSAHAFSWKDGVMTDLNDLLPNNSGWQLQYALGVNINGVIVGYGDFNGENRAYLLRP